MKGYPAWFNYKFIGGIFLVMLASGIFLIPQMLEFRLEQDFSMLSIKEYKTLTTGLHVVSGYIIFLILGAVWGIHMRVEWKRGQKRLNSVFLLILFGLSLLTGSYLLYGGSEHLLVPASLGHLGVGISLGFVFFYHIFKKSK